MKICKEEIMNNAYKMQDKNNNKKIKIKIKINYSNSNELCQIVFFVYQCDIQMPRKENEEEEDLFSLGIRKEKSSPSTNIKNQSSNCQLFVADFKKFSSMKTQVQLKSDFFVYK